MKKLLQGIINFRKNTRPEYRQAFAALALGQSPDALLIACSDSRVVPNLFASTEPGDLFVVRNVGNIVAPCTEDHGSPEKSEGAAIEFSTLTLNVQDIIVCGHSECGAMRALLDEKALEQHPHLAEWLVHAKGALQDVQNGVRLNADLSLQNQLSQLNVLRQIQHLKTFPSVRKRLEQGNLKLHAWWFDISAAEVQVYESKRERFSPLDEDFVRRILDQGLSL